MKQVYIAGGYGNAAYRNLFQLFGWHLTDTLPGSDLVLFTGGEDVSPELYGDTKHIATHSNMNRDEKEQAIYKEALSHKIPMVGICRGGQFLNVMNGGRMYQDVTNHANGMHVMEDLFHGKHYMVTSTHHQMMMPEENAIILGTAPVQSQRSWFDGTNQMEDQTAQGIEVVYYDKTNCLCYQPHPEYHQQKGDKYEMMAKKFFNLINKWSLT